MALHPLKGSERQPLPGAKSVGKADPAERLEVSVLLRRRSGTALTEHVKKLANREKGGGHLSREEFERQFGADNADMAAVKKFADAHGLAVVQEHAGRRTVVLSGTVAQFNAAFGVDLQRFEHSGGSYRGRVGAVHLPDELHDAVEAVLGLDDRPVAKPHFRARPSPGNVHWHANAGSATSFTPLQIASLYDFPSGTGQGQCVAIIELGGGERTADLGTYFSALGIQAAPKVTAVSVDHGKNHPTGDPNGPDGEVMLDIEVVGAIAPGGAYRRLFRTQHGCRLPRRHHHGGPRHEQQAVGHLHQLGRAGIVLDAAVAHRVRLGVPGGRGDGHHSLRRLGGQRLERRRQRRRQSRGLPCLEPVRTCLRRNQPPRVGDHDHRRVCLEQRCQGGASGGGVSSVFPLPTWQDGLQVTLTSGGNQALTMRGVPDVSGDADPETGYDVRIDGTDTVIGGTSAVAPLWAGLIARINAARRSSVGFINPLLYASPSSLNDITSGNNGNFAAGSHWDACTGLGSPDGAKIATLLEQPPTS